MRMKEIGDKATTLYELTTQPMNENTYPEMRARMESFQGRLAECTCAFYCQVSAETKLGRGNDDSFITILMPRSPRGMSQPVRSERILDVDDPLMYYWAPPADFDEMDEPGDGNFIKDSAEDVAHRKHCMWYDYAKSFAERFLTTWSCNAITDLLEKDLSRYTLLASKWLKAWEAADPSSLPDSITDSLEQLHSFMAAVRAVASSEPFTSETWKLYQLIFKPKRSDPKLATVFLDMVFTLKNNPEWTARETDAVRAATFEIHGSEDITKQIKKRGSDFEEEAFHLQVAENFVTWKTAVRSSMWNPFETALFTWIQEQVTAAQDDKKMEEAEWEPFYLPVLRVMADAAAQEEVVVGAVDLQAKITVIASVSTARFMLGAIAGWSMNGCDWEVFSGEGIKTACDRITGHEDLAEEMGGVAHLQTIGRRGVVAYKEKLAHFENLQGFDELKSAGANLVRITMLVDEVAPETFCDFHNGLTKLVAAAAACFDGTVKKQKKGGAQAFKKAFEAFTALGTQEEFSDYVTCVQQSPGYGLIHSKLMEITTAQANASKIELLQLLNDSESIAGGAEDGEGLWRASLAENAKVKDLIAHAKPGPKFLMDGDQRSNIFDKVQKAGRVLIES